MSATTEPSPKRHKNKRLLEPDLEREAVRSLVRAARDRGEDLTGPDGLLRSLTKTVPEPAQG